MEQYINLNDISNELLIIPKATIDTLMKLENCSECISLYIFYYKTAKWQKTNQIKANDEYVKKSLKWGIDKIRKTKKTLKENGLIEIIQSRSNNKIDGWYIQLNYLISSKKTEDIKVQVSNNTRFQQVGETTSSFQEVSALKEYIKCLKKEIEVLKKEKGKKENNCDDNFETFYQAYPRKTGKVNVEKWFNKNKPDEELMNKILTSLEEHKKLKQWQDKQFIPYPATWLNQKRWEDEVEVEEDTAKNNLSEVVIDEEEKQKQEMMMRIARTMYTDEEMGLK